MKILNQVDNLLCRLERRPATQPKQRHACQNEIDICKIRYVRRRQKIINAIEINVCILIARPLHGTTDKKLLKVFFIMFTLKYNN